MKGCIRLGEGILRVFSPTDYTTTTATQCECPIDTQGSVKRTIRERLMLLTYHARIFRFDSWSGGAVHLEIEATRVAEVIALNVSTPKWCVICTAIHAHTTL